jgi:hypothetical protein
MADSSNTTTLPADKRSPRVRLMDDISSLARMATINYGMVERAVCPTRAINCDKESGIYTFYFSGEWTEQLRFAAGDVMDRAKSIHARLELLEDEHDETAEQARPSKRFELIGNIEGSIAVLAGLVGNSQRFNK